MNTHVISIIIALLLAALCSLGLCAQDRQVSKDIRVKDFSEIEMNTVGNVYFTQSGKYSLKIEGKQKYVDMFTASVKNGKLTLSMQGEKQKRSNIKDGVDIYISAPDLKELDFSGVGKFCCDKPLKLDDVDLELEGVGGIEIKDLTCRRIGIKVQGVGDANINVDCDYLKASMQGVGSIVLSGKAQEADISCLGVGHVNRKNLIIKK